MARFRFKLEPVLRQRSIAERDEQLRVAAIERERLEFEAQLRAQQRTIEAETEALDGMTNGGRVDANTLRLQGVALADARARAQQIALRLAGVPKRLEAARAEPAAKAAERRAIELLKERQLEAFRRAELAKESRVLDDLASSAAIRETDR